MKRYHHLAGKYRFQILILAVATAGLSQGLTLPLLSILLEERGVSATVNGWNAASLYVGMLVSSFIVERPIRKYGYKPLILFGIVAVLCSTLLIPIYSNLFGWLVLRFLIGVGDSALHCATQMWISVDSRAFNRGKRISLYGFAYGTGFSIGPLGVNLLALGNWVPFLIVAVFYTLALTMVSLLENRFPDQPKAGEKISYRKTIVLSWYALLPALVYGYLESILNGNVPVYFLRLGLNQSWVSIILFSFSAGALITQLPLGLLSDRLGRKRILMVAGVLGALGFGLTPLVGSHPFLAANLLGCTGMVVGSFFSLGLAFLGDVLPKHLLPTGNVLASVLFSFGSMTGPGLTGMGMQYVHPASAFYFLGLLFGLFFLTGFISSHSIQLKLSQKSS